MELTESVNGAYIRQVATNTTPSMYNVASIALLKAANNPSAPVPFFPWKFPLRWETPVFSCTLLQDVRRTLFHLECCWVTAGCVNQLLFANKLMRYLQSYCRFKGSPNCITIGPDGDIKLSEPNFMQQFEIFLSKPQRSAQGRVRGSLNFRIHQYNLETLNVCTTFAFNQWGRYWDISLDNINLLAVLDGTFQSGPK